MKTLRNILASWCAFVLALLVTGMTMRVFNLPALAIPGNTSPGRSLAMTLVGGLVLVIGLWPIARGLSGSFSYRAVALVAFIGLAFGVNNLIESSVFTTLVEGHVGSASVFYLSIALLVGLTMAALFGSSQPVPRGKRGDIPLLLMRLVAAWFSFPVIYLIFGMCVSPIVVPYYSAIPFLHIPPMSTILAVASVRSAIFLACTLPLIALWKGSRRHLWIALGLAHAVVVGLYGLTSSTFLPRVLRVTHSLEIIADSFVYAWVLVSLFCPNGGVRAAKPEPEKAIHA